MKKRDPFKRLMENVLRSARSASQKGQKYGRENPLEVNIDVEYLKYIFKKQKGCCPYYSAIGVKRTLDMDLVFETFNALAPSVDRIDSSKGYIKGNIVITFRGINQMKQKNSKETFLSELKYFTFGNTIETNIPNKNMNAINNIMKVEGTFNPIDVDVIMKQFTTSYTQVLESVMGMQVRMISQFKVVEEVEVSPKKTKTRKSDKPSNSFLNVRLRNRYIKNFNDKLKLVPASKFFDVKRTESLLNRATTFFEDLGEAGALYRNPKGGLTDFYVDPNHIPTTYKK
jgi:hypothetical protein